MSLYLVALKPCGCLDGPPVATTVYKVGMKVKYAGKMRLVMEAKDSARVTENCQKCSLKGGLFE